MDLKNANKSQRDAIMHLSGPCLVLAGPGSGKTYTITNRILYLLERGVPPASVLVITFMKEAALSMQNRFREMLQAPGSNHTASVPVNFGTFHSVFYHILKESRVLSSTELLGDSEKKKIILPILQKYGEKQEAAQGRGDLSEAWQNYESDLKEEAAQILSAIGFYKNTMDMPAAAKKAPAKWQPCFEGICEEYEYVVRRTGRLDFDDMIYRCKSLLEENAPARKYWQERFRHILIDEFQDINPVQYEVVKLLAAKPYNLFAVGDDDQAIYGFRGSKPECIRRFAEEFRARQLVLEVNYRSRQEIVRASLSVIEENKNRFPKRLRAAPAEEGGREENMEKEKEKEKEIPVIRAFPEKEDQHRYMLQEITSGLKEEDSCAVLFRTNSYMQVFAAKLKSSGIPYEMKERAGSIYEHFIVRDLMAYLQVARGSGSREQMLRIINRPSRYVGRESVGSDGTDIRKISEYYRRAQMPEAQREKVMYELCRLERQLEKIRGFMLRPAVSYILKAVGYEGYLREISKSRPEKWAEWQELLEWVKADAAAYSDLEGWKTAQEEYAKTIGQKAAQRGEGPAAWRDGGAIQRAAQRDVPQDVQGEVRRDVQGDAPRDVRRNVQQAVHLMTVHGAKGLEFDRVWIPDCNEKIFPHGVMPDEHSVEEERRIFYVAMTRAKKSLELLYLTGTKERPRLPSRFLNPLFS